ncbi:MAG: MFS transporter [Betaproteobacteria bacterium]|nr:MFS transporter [Betaproteobacteria bacterium]
MALTFIILPNVRARLAVEPDTGQFRSGGYVEDRRPCRILPAIVFSQFAGTSLWFAGNAVLPDLQLQFGLGQSAVATITSAVQLGFIAGTLVFAVLNLSDRFSPRSVFLACSAFGALANGGIALLANIGHPYETLLGMRFATGFFLAGIYPVGMKLAASWYREGLGAALGFLVGALVIGTAFPHLVKGLGHSLPWEEVTWWLSGLALTGGIVMYMLVPDGPHHAKGTRLDLGAIVAIFASRDLRASAFGYFGHMWELYTLWAMIPLMIAGYVEMHTLGAVNVGLWSFWVIAVGAIGCVAGGLVSRHVGSAKVAFTQLSLSGLCCLLSPLAYVLPLPAFIAFLTVWGIFVVGDSPQFSALTAATAPRAFVGSALTIVNCIGFSITVVSIQVTSMLTAHLPLQAWFVPVAIGPVLGLSACRRLVRPMR